MKKSEFISEISKQNVPLSCKLTKWGSEYWTIDGIRYRVSDHRKEGISMYEYGINDFSDYGHMMGVVLKNIEKENEFRHLTYDQKEMLKYGRFLMEDDMDEFNNWIKYHEEFNELNNN